MTTNISTPFCHPEAPACFSEGILEKEIAPSVPPWFGKAWKLFRIPVQKGVKWSRESFLFKVLL